MTRIWFEVRIRLPSSKFEDFVLKVVSPIVKEFKREIELYHFLNEGYFLFRAKASRTAINRKIVPFVRQLIDGLKGEMTLEPAVSYCCDETSEWGEKGVKFAYPMLELASGTLLAKLEAKGEGFETSNKFNPIYFSHLFLNAWGFEPLKEAHEHWKEGTFRLFCHYTKDGKEAQELYGKYEESLSTHFIEYTKIIQSLSRSSISVNG